MRGVTFLGERKLQLAEFPDPTPGPRDVIVAIKASGMCGSDLKPYRATGGSAALGLGKVSGPVIAGHEPCGVVAAVGGAVDERTARIGARVMVHHYSGCGACRHCQTGWTQMCSNGSIVYGITGHGAHAPYMKVPAQTLVPLPDELSFATGAAISCGTGTAYQALRRMNVAGGDAIAIVGQGPVGLSATQLAAAMGARVIALDVSAERLSRAKEFGADALIDPKAGDAVAAIRELTRGTGADMTLELIRDAGRTFDRGARHAGLGHDLFCRRRRRRHARCEPAYAAQAAHHYRFMDFFHRRASGLRALHRRPQDRRRASVHASLATCASR